MRAMTNHPFAMLIPNHSLFADKPPHPPALPRQILAGNTAAPRTRADRSQGVDEFVDSPPTVQSVPPSSSSSLPGSAGFPGTGFGAGAGADTTGSALFDCSSIFPIRLGIITSL